MRNLRASFTPHETSIYTFVAFDRPLDDGGTRNLKTLSKICTYRNETGTIQNCSYSDVGWDMTGKIFRNLVAHTMYYFEITTYGHGRGLQMLKGATANLTFTTPGYCEFIDIFYVSML